MQASKRARAELKQNKGVPFFLNLLSTLNWQEAALHALLVWLNDEQGYVERFITTAHGVAQLRAVLAARSSSAFVNILEDLLQIVHKSSSISSALGRIDPVSGISPFIQLLLSRLAHPSARVRRLLLSVLLSIYEKHTAPKQLVKKHMLTPLLHDVMANDSGVLVRKVASRLLAGLLANDVV
jgi:hypothetical protein